MPRLGLGIHEFGTAGNKSWIPRPSLGMTTEWWETQENIWIKHFEQ
jgi:hypothetical protein